MTPAINNDINSLSPSFRKKFNLRWYEVITKYPNAVVFEARRSQERQNWLYAQGRTRPGKVVTWTTTSNHFSGNAVDIVFRNNGKLEWAGPYQDLIVMAKKYGIRNLAPKELCHFEDDGTPLNVAVEPTPVKVEETRTLEGIEMASLGVWNGKNPSGYATREEVAIMLQRLYHKILGS